MAAQHGEDGACQCPPPLDDQHLIAALENDVDTSVIEHLRVCPACTARARELATFERALRRRLYRALCPGSDDLLAFQQRILNPERYISIADHLADCAHCARELRILDRAALLALPLASAAPAPGRHIRARLETPFAPLFAAGGIYGRVRGNSPGGQYVYRAEHLQLTIAIERTNGRPGRHILTGLLSTGNAPDLPPGATASLLSVGRVVSSAPIDSLGCFLIEDVPSGEHTLSIRLPECEVLVDSIRL